ncbi:channel protein, MIP family [Teladorsagia circumcincta]|uniref:Channel protein, MIP family n=1 Tax=Teladorsagia circumcincta TaxID=45464 RepID=A0A2G9UXJ6_TELCI|nr:channel protein, MIP family [Teladorsagia circumcincta]
MPAMYGNKVKRMSVRDQHSPAHQSYDLTKGLKRFTDWSVSGTESIGDSGKKYSLITKMIAEFLGDFTFVFVGTMQAVVVTGLENESIVADNIVHAALAHGFTIFILVAALGHISGGHFNPVVTWAVAAAGKMPIHHVPFYWFAQFLGGFCGSLYSVLIMTHNQLESSFAGATLLNPDNKWWEGMMSEAVVTYFLVHTILLVAADTDTNLLAPLAIGLTLSIDILATGLITGASMNPARSLGPNIVGQIFLDSNSIPLHFWSYHYIYWAGPFMGSTVAVILYRLFEARENRLLR